MRLSIDTEHMGRHEEALEVTRLTLYFTRSLEGTLLAMGKLKLLSEEIADISSLFKTPVMGGHVVEGHVVVFPLGGPSSRASHLWRSAARWRRQRWRTSMCAAASGWTCSAASCAWASRRGAGRRRPGPPRCRATRPRSGRPHPRPLFPKGLGRPRPKAHVLHLATHYGQLKIWHASDMFPY